MRSLVVYESVYGNTRAVAEAIAEGLGGAEVVLVHEAPTHLDDVDLLLGGGHTHMHGMTTARSRQLAVEAVHEDGTGHVEPRAAAEPGLRAWTGLASRGIGKRLRRRGYELLGTESFLVEDSEGPLEQGELDRARAWGAELDRLLPAATSAKAS